MMQVVRVLFCSVRRISRFRTNSRKPEEKRQKIQKLQKTPKTMHLKGFLPEYVPKEDNKYAFISSDKYIGN